MEIERHILVGRMRQQLQERIAAIEADRAIGAPASAAGFGERREPGGTTRRGPVEIGPGNDPDLTLARGFLHELVGLCDGPRGSRWQPPASLLVHLAARIGGSGAVVWVGRACWPAPWMLGEGGLLDRSLCVDPGRQIGTRLWATDLAVRSSAVAAVVADGTGLDMAGSRRLQLAAKAHRTLVLLARPPGEQSARSAAASRWRVEPEVTDRRRPSWRLRLLRAKGQQLPPEKQTWIAEFSDEADLVTFPAPLADRPPAAAPRQRYA
ncbi:MAG: ImuA family protein [Phycisphaeraceae bacterium]